MIQQRLDRLIVCMKEHNLDQVLITEDLNLFYYTGSYEQSMERLRVLLVGRDGSCRYYANELFPSAGLCEFTFSHRDGAELSALGDLAIHLRPGARVAVDRMWSAGYLLSLLPLAPHCTFVSAEAVLSAPMACKDSRELALMCQSSQINDQVVGELISSIGESATETGLCNDIHSLYSRYGADGFAGGAMVAFGANCAAAHPQPHPVHPQIGDSILIDAGAPYRFYQSDMTRTVFFRDVSREMERIYNVVLEANLAGIDAVRPGRPAHEVDAACRAVIEKNGYGPYFTHRTGHGIGLQLHEAPSISPHSDTVLQEGMVFSIEPGIYIPTAGGVRIEDLVAVTSNGVQVLNRLPKGLTVLY